jgi:hypothetical protein
MLLNHSHCALPVHPSSKSPCRTTEANDWFTILIVEHTALDVGLTEWQIIQVQYSYLVKLLVAMFGTSQ